MKPVARDGFEGEMISMAQNGLHNISLSKEQEQPKQPIQEETTTGTVESSIVKNQQESTFSVAGDSTRKKIFHLYSCDFDLRCTMLYFVNYILYASSFYLLEFPICVLNL